jgi:2-hydroxy-6-oxonona-2,4-dienedioate hydrolase
MRERGGAAVCRWIAVGGLRIHYRVWSGRAPAGRLPVVLVHGFGVSSRYMVPLAETLARDFRVYAPDLPGFGRSDQPASVLDISGLAEALSAWMAALDLGPAVLIGNSLGCQVIIEVALRQRERVACLVLQGPTPDPAARTAGQQLLRQMLIGRHDGTPKMMWIALTDFLTAGPRRLRVTFKHYLDHPIEERLTRVAAPALVLRGAHDALVPPQWARTAAALLPRGRLVEVAGAAHVMNFHAPERFARVVRRYLGVAPAAFRAPVG